MHDHASGNAGIRGGSNRRLLAVSLGITSVVMLVQVVGAILSGSLALLADAAHMFTDASALVIALIAAVFGFGGIAAGAVGIAKILFFVFIILAVIAFITGRRGP